MPDRISRYSGLERPETKEAEAATGEPLNRIISAYNIFMGIEKKAPKNQYLYIYKELAGILYQEACRLLDGCKPSGRDQVIIDHIAEKAADHDASGVFLSAYLNCTDADELVVDYFPCDIDYIGYRLKEGKRLILGNGVDGYRAGYHSRGSVLSWGRVDQLCFGMEGGICANWGDTDLMGELASGGALLNFCRADKMAGGARSVLSVNFASTEYMAQPKKGTSISTGWISGAPTFSVVRHGREIENDKNGILERDIRKAVSGLDKFRQLEQFVLMKDVDFAGLEKEAFNAAKAVEDYLGGKHG